MDCLDMTTYMKTVLDEIYEGVSICDRDSRVLFFNKAYERIEGVPREKIIGRTEDELWQTGYGERVMSSGVPIHNECVVYKTPAGKEIKTVHSVIPYYQDGQVAGMFSIARNITTIDKFISRTYALQHELGKGENNIRQNGTRYTLEQIIGESPQIRHCIEQARKAAFYPANILISGETGTGKELFAQGIHNLSENSASSFVGINCAAIPEALLESLLFGTEKGAFTGAQKTSGLFEQAGQGTLFLDEIDSMPLSMQAKLLRVLAEKKIRRIGGQEEIKVGCRIISAVNSQLAPHNGQELIRRDLYYRIAAFLLEVPPLRERDGDILVLANHFLKKYAQELGADLLGFDAGAESALLHYSWPGNVRELEHVVESAIIIDGGESSQISRGYLPTDIQGNCCCMDHPDAVMDREMDLDLRQMVDAYEAEIIKKALLASGENISAAARKLKIHRNVFIQQDAEIAD